MEKKKNGAPRREAPKTAEDMTDAIAHRAMITETITKRIIKKK